MYPGIPKAKLSSSTFVRIIKSERLTQNLALQAKPCAHIPYQKSGMESISKQSDTPQSSCTPHHLVISIPSSINDHTPNSSIPGKKILTFSRPIKSNYTCYSKTQPNINCHFENMRLRKNPSVRNANLA